MDMLVKLYDLHCDTGLDRRMADQDITLRRALVPELKAICDWIEPRFGSSWAAEATAAIMRQPVTCFIAHQGATLLGFACHDATMKGFFGPTGVDQAARGKGVGHALLITTLIDMRAQGYAYAIIGGAGPMDFYQKSVGAVPIEGSKPGIYRGMIPAAAPNGVSG
ncbi:GNAT family N-acetyltransferase [Rhizobium sp. SL42]|uniref:GNAT family N-acetyltransferase n=1 Tax=Rhizobium sp. SL42 TaxID=2806346 RepID=UPI001F1CFCDE|nr:GNAT family N-acetyltransferase [Rhizobium sp. SL42]UJW74886.1 GNAT family N-acetyltransferase [Rhizobium sp. SL42]